MQPRNRNISYAYLGLLTSPNEEVVNMIHIHNMDDFIDRSADGLEHNILTVALLWCFVLNHIKKLALFVFNFVRVLSFAQFTLEARPVKCFHTWGPSLNPLQLEPTFQAPMMDVLHRASTATRCQQRIVFWTFLFAEAHTTQWHFWLLIILVSFFVHFFLTSLVLFIHS